MFIDLERIDFQVIPDTNTDNGKEPIIDSGNPSVNNLKLMIRKEKKKTNK